MKDTHHSANIALPIPKQQKSTTQFKKELTELLNHHGWDSMLGTCDFILADNIERYLQNLNIMQEKQKRRSYESF